MTDEEKIENVSDFYDDTIRAMFLKMAEHKLSNESCLSIISAVASVSIKILAAISENDDQAIYRVFLEKLRGSMEIKLETSSTSLEVNFEKG